ncbi:chitin synthase-domain-containing protein [Myxozyma melibiosi]|uniref:chitin synthase n=1 Tax=Myxozyma melibiosi TaxID=54550 RepID=A0ABR1FE46_9ASCO
MDPSTPDRGLRTTITTSTSAPLIHRTDLERGPSGRMPNSASTGDFQRKRSLVKPERSRINKDHPTYYYAQHAAKQNMPVLPSSTGNDPNTYDTEEPEIAESSDGAQVYYDDDEDSTSKGSPTSKITDVNLADSPSQVPQRSKSTTSVRKPRLQSAEQYKPPSLWQSYCALITFWAPPIVMGWCGMPTKARQSAWREKIGLISVILMIGAIVGFQTFGFTEVVCKSAGVRLRSNHINTGYLIINGRAYDLTSSSHPLANGISSGSNILYPPTNAGGMDASFLFQNVNSHCKDLFTPADNSDIPYDDDNNMGWYFPCKTFAQDGSSSPNFTWSYYTGYACHTSTVAREAYYGLDVTAEVYLTWDDIRNASRNLVVYSGYVLDLDLLDWLDTDNVEVTTDRFTELQDASRSGVIRGTDITRLMTSAADRKVANCMIETIKIGSVDTDSIGCIASDIVLYISLTFIVLIIIIKFVVACIFAWFLSWRLGVKYSAAEKKRMAEIEDWSDDIYRPAPHIINAYNNGGGNRGSRFFPRTSRFTSPYAQRDRSRSRQRGGALTTMASQAQLSTSHLIVPGSLYASRNDDAASNLYSSGASTYAGASSPASMPAGFASTSSLNNQSSRGREGAPADVDSIRMSQYISAEDEAEAGGVVSFYQDNVVPQPPADFQPFGYPLVHTVCLVTTYSESLEGVRTTLDSIATTDYPNSHKLIMIVCDGIVRGAGNEMSTPDICLSMMKDFAVPPEEVEAFSYVAVAQGTKRHNMAKVYAGFYAYDDETVDPSKQQRVPIITIVKCGTPSEKTLAKPGNRGKRDSQIIIMAFFQKVMFDERMTELEYEMFNGIWRVTGISPDMYEIILMVDADTKVYPDSLTHMISCMVHDTEVMGLCGETKIGNKRQSWVTMIQVFEYYVSHHLSKAFESAFGSVTCLPGCFCMYRLKAPKGEDGYWVPILANPDIVERYSDNVIDTLHKKNLLLLGEDRYLSTLMLRTFPRRKQIFVPQAVCKTVAPDTMSVLLSQRRRWINSTVHNLMELTMVNTLCGVFCVSMQFVVTIELIGTVVLPIALSFTIYVIVIAIVRKPVPVVSLVLLALVLGLPGVLVVVTAHRWSYVLWMLIYLMALPIWNFLLPMNAYWRFDDFSWGETRQVQGGNKAHDEAEGEFDSSHIKMRRWRDFEAEKRNKLQGTQHQKQNSESYGYRASSPGAWPTQ